MTNHDRGTTDEGGEAPCFAASLDQRKDVPVDQLAELVVRLADAVIIAEADGTIAFWNEAAARLFGFTADEAVGKTLDLIIPERLRQRHWEGFRSVMATGQTSYGDRLLEVPALHADGRRLSIAFTVTLLHGDDGAPRAIAALVRDDTQRFVERKRLRDELAELRASSSTGDQEDVRC